MRPDLKVAAVANPALARAWTAIRLAKQRIMDMNRLTAGELSCLEIERVVATHSSMEGVLVASIFPTDFKGGPTFRKVEMDGLKRLLSLDTQPGPFSIRHCCFVLEVLQHMNKNDVHLKRMLC